MDDARRFRVSLGEREANWRTARALAEDADGAPELTGLLDSDGAGATIASCAPEVDPERQARLVSELRKNLAEQRLLMAEQQADQRRSGPSEGPPQCLERLFGRARGLRHRRPLGRRGPRSECTGGARDLHRDGRGRLCAPGRHDRGAAAAPGPDTRGEDRRGDRQ